MPETTQRAYTLRLQGQNPKDDSWREALWKTHEAVNRGAKAFGDWLLTLRGGLDHSLADDPPEKQRKQRRILLALSWLTVESENGAPPEYIVPHDRDEISGTRRNWKTIEALREILKNRGCRDDEIESWCNDCKSSLTSAIREDAVWVNRSKAFDAACHGQDIARAREDSRTILWYLLGNNYLTLPRTPKNPSEETEDEASEGKNVSGKGAGQRTRHLFSHIFGRKKNSKGFGKPPRQLALREYWKTYLKPRVEASGIPMRDAEAGKTNGTSPTEFHREMFAKAASRLAQVHTKLKQQEVEHQKRKAAEENLKRLESDEQFKQALNLLDALCNELGATSGAQEKYRIRPRQINGWDRVVMAWESKVSTIQREEAVKHLQGEGSIEKFGDIHLFLTLAEEKYTCIWRHADSPMPKLLKIYVEGEEARANALRRKVAAFRHPDPYFNPVFCQFGVSRPRLMFRRLRSFTAKPEGKDVRSVSLLLWDGVKADMHQFQGLSKRMDREIGAVCDPAQNDSSNLTVTRRSRLAIAALEEKHPVPPNKVRVAYVFEPKKVKPRKTEVKEVEADDPRKPEKKKDPKWNGSLWGDRWTLATIGRFLNKNEQALAEKHKGRLNWWLIVSLELSPQGPWINYAKGLNLIRDGSVVIAPSKHEDEWRGLAYPFWHPSNKEGRQGLAKHRLSRLPGLRVLSVDLGHRHAAACAVWETLSKAAFEQEIRERQILRGGTGPNDLFCHTRHVTNGQSKVTIYRRIGADTLPDGTPHPAPWARLDRQFLIKLPGEEREARKASPTELAQVEKLEKGLGRKTPDNRAKRIDDLMSDTLRTVYLALRRHSLRARIAFNLTTTQRNLPGGRVESLGEQDRVTLLCETLKMWHSLLKGDDWTDDWAKALWDEHIMPLLPPFDNQKADETEWLKPAAEELASNPTKTQELHILWARRWQEDEQPWRERLRWLRRWILPRGIQTSAQKASIRHVGGLSLTRLATIKTLYQVLKAYHMRPEPDNPRNNNPAEGDDALQNFGRKILDDLEHMREQRVKQLASRIVEAALGLGRMKQITNGKDPKRPRERVDQSCHAVVIENLTHYRPEERQTRRENRQLMNWSSSKVKKYLKESCQLHGLHLVEVSASYTSRQDSRTGAPGIRCQEVPLPDFLKKPFWYKEVKQAKRRLSEGKANARDRYLCQLYERWDNAPAPQTQTAIHLRIPMNGGELFVSADQNSPASKGIQADLNAAANIGLRAITDPDWSGAWWYIPCEANTFKPVEDKVAGSAAIDPNVSLKKDSPHSEKPASAQKRSAPRSRASKEDIINLWCDISSKSIYERDQWQEFVPYWEDVAARVIKILQASLVCSTTNSQ